MCPTHLVSDGLMLMRIFSPVFAAYPQRSCPHCSMRTFPLFPSVAQMPSGVVGAAVDAAATGACFGAADATAGATSSLTGGGDDVGATGVEAGGGGAGA